ncbi:MAG TPA: tRNA (adenosine(37)-N6)-threonylcarbamoyltransferase complex dimerization subunit type 1 TsaB [Dehalococcoidia bacterium]|nr:tRNA (adenosine(37)-N6)-threonylcarbamoyltransferase complex dimerization subunit type 1 TsaB [Dehalococcoidia bacterium]
MPTEKNLLVALDTAADIAGVALLEDGALLSETTWRAHQSHSRDLLPALDWLLSRHGRTKDDIAAVCVCLGPGSYAGLRVGVSTAKALAYALDVPLAGVNRLEADAFFVAEASGARVIALQAAGRAELAWAAYGAFGHDLRELIAPRLDPVEALLAIVAEGDVITGEAKAFENGLSEALAAKGARIVEAPATRVLAIATLGAQRIARGQIDNPDTLVPLYLRAPAIGPKR